MFNNIDAAMSVVTLLSLVAAVGLIASAFLPDGAPVRAQDFAPQTLTATAPPPGPLHRPGDRPQRRPPSLYRGPWTL